MHANFADLTPDGFHIWKTLSPRTSEPVRQAPEPLEQNSGDATVSIVVCILAASRQIPGAEPRQWMIDRIRMICIIFCLCLSLSDIQCIVLYIGLCM